MQNETVDMRMQMENGMLASGTSERGVRRLPYTKATLIVHGDMISSTTGQSWANLETTAWYLQPPPGATRQR